MTGTGKIKYCSWCRPNAPSLIHRWIQNPDDPGWTVCGCTELGCYCTYRYNVNFGVPPGSAEVVRLRNIDV